MPKPRGAIQEVVSPVYASRTKADNNEAIIPSGQFSKLCNQEEIRWSADAIPIRAHGTKDLSTATKRVGAARIRAACSNAEHFASRPRLRDLLGSAKSIRRPLAVVSSSYNHIDINTLETPPLDDEDSLWREEAQCVISAYNNKKLSSAVSLMNKKGLTLDNMLTSTPSQSSTVSTSRTVPKASSPKHKGTPNSAVSASDKSKEAFKQMAQRFISDLRIGQRHLGAAMASRNLIKCADLAAKEKSLMSLTENFTSEKSNLSRTLTTANSPSPAYKAAFTNYKNYKLNEGSVELYLASINTQTHGHKVPITLFGDTPASEVIVTTEVVSRYPDSVISDTASMESSQGFMFGVSESIMTALPLRWQDSAKSVWQQWQKLRLFQEIASVKAHIKALENLDELKELDSITLSESDSSYLERFNQWWYETVYLPLPRIWRGHAMTANYRFVLKNIGSSDHIVPMNTPKADIRKSSAQDSDSESHCPTLAVCGIATKHNPDVPLLLAEFAGLLAGLTSVDDGATPTVQPKVLLTPSTLSSYQPAFKIHFQDISPQDSTPAQMAPELRNQTQAAWNKSIRSLSWRGLSSNPVRSEMTETSKSNLITKPRFRRDLGSSVKTVSIKPCPAEKVDAFVSSTSTAVSALFIVLFLVRSACMVCITSLWTECLVSEEDINVENLYKRIHTRWFKLPYASYLKSASNCSDLNESEEESAADNSVTDTREFISGRVLGHLPDSVCWPYPEIVPETNIPHPVACSDDQATCFSYDSLFLQAAKPFGHAIEVLWELAIKMRNIARIPYGEAQSYCHQAAEIAHQIWYELVTVGGLTGLKLVEAGERSLFRLAVGDLLGEPNYMSNFKNVWRQGLTDT